MEGIASLADARPFGGQESCGEEFALGGLIAEADLSPLAGRTESPFCSIVGRLDSAVFEKGEQTVPMLEQAFGRLGYIAIGAGAMQLEAPAHTAAHGHRFLNEALPIHVATQESMPQGKQSAYLGK
jgi:hypothetical protein